MVIIFHIEAFLYGLQDTLMSPPVLMNSKYILKRNINFLNSLIAQYDYMLAVKNFPKMESHIFIKKLWPFHHLK